MIPVRLRRLFTIGLLVTGVSGAIVRGDNAWNDYHWARTANPFTLKVGDNVSDKWDAYLDAAIVDWTVSSVLDLTKVAGGTTGKRCRPTAGRIEACSERYGRTGWLGVAQIWLSGSHITQATTKVNDTYFDTARYNTPSWRQLVMCQEIAHDFGLDHQDETFDNPNLGSCMDYTNSPEGNEHPNAHDYAMIEEIYGSHLDTTSTVDTTTSMPPAMGQIDFENPGQWGRLVRSLANGRVQVFELDFGRGFRMITRVVWAAQR